MDTPEQMGVAAGSHVKRQRRSVEEKRRIVEPGASVARGAQRHAINANQILAWRKKYREGRLGSRATAKLLTVAITDEWLSEAEGWRARTARTAGDRRHSFRCCSKGSTGGGRCARRLRRWDVSRECFPLRNFLY